MRSPTSPRNLAKPPTGSPTTTEVDWRQIVPYIAPILVFLILTNLEGYLPGPAWYPLAYTLKVLVVAFFAFLYRRTWADFRPVPRPQTIALAAMIGLYVFVFWIKLEGCYPALPLLGQRTGFDPGTLSTTWKLPFLTIRFLGLVLLVPVIEELFWRSFLIRWLIDPNFLKVPIGQVTPAAAAITSAVFAFSHPEWLPALLTGLLWAWLLWQTRSLSACLISHAVANLALGIHVLVTGDWKYW
jgi:CAAX prenyl protease-like protein